MGSALVEIVPNFSEGRRTEVIEAILQALRVPGVRMLTWQADPDHNRLDASLVGSPEAVRRSVLAGTAKAAELIDMERHHGNHPRMGATDVIPFLPVRGVSMEECAELARDVAREIGERLGIPVYCYGEAALDPARRSLADVRKGEYEAIRDDVAAGRRLPDFGPASVGSAGAVAVGARKPLVAFNVYFAGDDEAAVKAVARSVRESSGGLRNVRAIGFGMEDRGRVTVSMNMVDLDATPLHRALELVRAEAARFGLTVRDTEIVGMVPEHALTDAAGFYLQLAGFAPDEQILERVLATGSDDVAGPADVPLGDRTVAGFLDGLAAATSTPGGGTAAATTGATGAALVAMTARMTAGKSGFEAADERMAAILREADEARAEFVDLAERDALAFDAVMAAYRLPRSTEEELATRRDAVQDALVRAATVPLETAALAVRIQELAEESMRIGNPNLRSDAAAAGELLAASCRAAAWNVEVNADSIADDGIAAMLREESRRLVDRAGELAAGTAAAFRSTVPS
jgi:glutamate formiminotransferase/formiminotetrahydrofolate cyclodeaminase